MLLLCNQSSCSTYIWVLLGQTSVALCSMEHKTQQTRPKQFQFQVENRNIKLEPPDSDQSFEADLEEERLVWRSIEHKTRQGRLSHNWIFSGKAGRSKQSTFGFFEFYPPWILQRQTPTSKCETTDLQEEKMPKIKCSLKAGSSICLGNRHVCLCEGRGNTGCVDVDAIWTYGCSKFFFSCAKTAL